MRGANRLVDIQAERGLEGLRGPALGPGDAGADHHLDVWRLVLRMSQAVAGSPDAEGVGVLARPDDVAFVDPGSRSSCMCVLCLVRLISSLVVSLRDGSFVPTLSIRHPQEAPSRSIDAINDPAALAGFQPPLLLLGRSRTSPMQDVLRWMPPDRGERHAPQAIRPRDRAPIHDRTPAITGCRPYRRLQPPGQLPAGRADRRRRRVELGKLGAGHSWRSGPPVLVRACIRDPGRRTSIVRAQVGWASAARTDLLSTMPQFGAGRPYPQGWRRRFPVHTRRKTRKRAGGERRRIAARSAGRDCGAPPDAGLAKGRWTLVRQNQRGTIPL